jgi:ppGpp synthetase/RelA/SpoT-type nucleotidyltranferase
MTSTSVRDEYERRYPLLVEVSENLKAHLSGLLAGVARVDAIAARAKSPDRYEKKAQKVEDGGLAKYTDPISEIQDQIGARVTVFYLPDVEIIRQHVVRFFRFIEQKEKTPGSDAEIGYFGLHFILQIPDDVVPDGADLDDVPQFFELQIKTLFQHAWSEAHHDLGYKSIRDLTPDERRKVAFTAAQAWGADTIFEELAKNLVFNDNELPADNSTTERAQ